MRVLSLVWLAALVAMAAADATTQPEELPAPAEILSAVDGAGQWRRTETPTAYGHENLWEYIDGAASLFVSYDFEAMATTVYEAEGVRGRMTVDLYLLPDELWAFGLYARERGPDAELEDIGAEGYSARNACRFVKGRYYVKLSLAPPPPEPVSHLRALAKRLAETIPGATELPPILSVFPREGLDERSVVFVGSDLLGHSFLRTGFLADYDVGADDPARMFLFIADDEDEADAAYAGLVAFLEKRGEIQGELDGLGSRAFRGTTPYSGPMVAVVHKHLVAGLVGPATAEKARELLAETLRRTLAFLEEGAA